MSKINNKILLIVLVVLAGAYFGNKYLGNPGERNFKDVLLNIDSAQVDRIVLTNQGTQININKTAPGKFDVINEAGFKDEGDIGMIRSMIASHMELKPERLVANSSDKWAEYEVNDSTGVNVKMFSGNKLLSELYVGKFDFQQATRSMSTMVRIGGEDQVYAVDGFLSSTFKIDFNGIRDKTFLKAEKDAITSVIAEYPADSSFHLELQNGNWMINGQPADSGASVRYANGLIFLNLRDFVNDFNPNEAELLYKLTIDGDSINTIIVECYKPGEDYILHSTLNENSYFKPGVTKIFEKLFPPKENFYLKPQ